MKIDNVKNPESAFLAQEKDMKIIVDRMAANQRLRKLLYYTTPDALKKPEVSDQNFAKMFGKNIRNLPKLYIDKDVLNYIVISFDNFAPNGDNPEYRDNTIEFDIICHYNQWQLADSFQLRPYRIAAELDSMLDKKHLTGIGQLNFVGAQQIILTDEFAGLCLLYDTIHGGEDKKYMPNPADEQMFIEDYFKMPKMN